MLLMQKPLILFAQWFGSWPEWIDFFVESCRWNADIDWLVFTDQDPPENQAPNVSYRKIGFAEHKARIGETTGIDLTEFAPYKLCDFKPCLGLVFDDETEGYRNYGHCDIDLIFGNIRAFYTDEVLERYEVLSTTTNLLSGHLAVLRNTPFNKRAFRRIRHWTRKAADPKNQGLDEYRFGKVFARPSLWRRLTERRPRVLFEERYTTPMTRVPWIDGSFDYPTRWFWKAGRLTAEGYGDREFIYLHFMNWKSSTMHVLRNGATAAPWLALDRVVTMDWRKAAAEGFMISHDGIGPLPPMQADAPAIRPQFADA
jgi:hypothetical protein